MNNQSKKNVYSLFGKSTKVFIALFISATLYCSANAQCNTYTARRFKAGTSNTENRGRIDSIGSKSHIIDIQIINGGIFYLLKDGVYSAYLSTPSTITPTKIPYARTYNGLSSRDSMLYAITNEYNFSKIHPNASDEPLNQFKLQGRIASEAMAVESYLFSSNQDLIIATRGKGVFWYKEDAHGYFQAHRILSVDSLHLPSDNVFSLFEDARGIIWIGTDKGVSVIVDNQVHNLAIRRRRDKRVLLTRPVSAIIEREGNVILGGKDGLFMIEHDKGLPNKMTPIDIGSVTLINDLLLDEKNDLWVAGNKLIHYLFASETAINIADSTTTYRSGHASCLAFNRESKELWVGTHGSGIYVISRKNSICPPINRLFIAKQITFLADSTVLTEEANIYLNSMYEFLFDSYGPNQGNFTNLTIEIIGHTSELKRSAVNPNTPAAPQEPLSQRRASAVRDYLIDKRIPAQIIGIEGKEDREPLPGLSPDDPRNRRVEIRINVTTNKN